VIEGNFIFEGSSELPRLRTALGACGLDRAGQGLDFADALHLGRASGCSAFMSFDRKLARAAAGVTDVEVAAP